MTGGYDTGRYTYAIKYTQLEKLYFNIHSLPRSRSTPWLVALLWASKIMKFYKNLHSGPWHKHPGQHASIFWQYLQNYHIPHILEKKIMITRSNGNINFMGISLGFNFFYIKLSPGNTFNHLRSRWSVQNFFLLNFPCDPDDPFNTFFRTFLAIPMIPMIPLLLFIANFFLGFRWSRKYFFSLTFFCDPDDHPDDNSLIFCDPDDHYLLFH